MIVVNNFMHALIGDWQGGMVYVSSTLGGFFCAQRVSVCNQYIAFQIPSVVLQYPLFYASPSPSSPRQFRCFLGAQCTATQRLLTHFLYSEQTKPASLKNAFPHNQCNHRTYTCERASSPRFQSNPPTCQR